MSHNRHNLNLLMNTIPTPSLHVCQLEEIPDGKGRVFQLFSNQKEIRLLLLRSGDNCFAYINRCPHFGVPLATVDSQLILEANRWVKCNVHYSRFRWQDGYCEAGECEGESLQKVALDIQNRTITIPNPNFE